MKENPHPFLVSIHTFEEKIEQLTREVKIKRIHDTEIMLLDNADFIQLFKLEKLFKEFRKVSVAESKK